jgi:branched-chain amino acid transport system substrate-binding protein
VTAWRGWFSLATDLEGLACRILIPATVVLAACTPRTPPPPTTSAAVPVTPLVVSLPTPAPAGSLPVATIFPTVGRHALSGVQSLDGVRLAVADVNREGGVHGRPLALLEYGIGSYFLDARQAAVLSAESGALAIVGSNSSDLSMAIAEVAESRGLVQVSNVSTVQELTFDPATGRTRSFVFRVCSTDVVMGSMLATFARERLYARRAAILYEVGRVYSTRLARSFIEHFDDPARGREVEEFSYLSLETDFRPQLGAIKAFDPDVLFVPGSFTDATLIAGQAKKVGLEVTLLGADAWSNPLLFKRSAPPAEAYFVDHCSPPTAWNARYGETFRRQAHGCRAALAYDALRTVVAGLRALGPLTEEGLEKLLPETRRRLRRTVAAADFSGLTGRVRFDAVGDRRRTGVAVLEVVSRPDDRREVRVHGWVGER